MTRPLSICTILLGAVLVPALGAAAGVRVAFDAADPRRSPFPSDRFTVRDLTQLTGRRVNLPSPPCGERPSDCEDVAILNTLDGFNLQPRLSIPFDGPIDVSTVTSRSVFLVSLGSTRPGGRRPGRVVGINQVVWDPAGLTVYAESEELLDPHTRYLLVVTSGVRDASGHAVQPPGRFDESARAALAAVPAHRVGFARIVAATVFTTQSSTTLLERVRRQIGAATPAPVDFALGPAGSRAVFSLGGIAGITLNRQVGAGRFVTQPLPVAFLNAVPGAVGTVAFGRYVSPNYATPQGVIPPVPSRTGVPAVQRTEDVYFTLFLPAGPMPAGGWPVALFGHGFGDSRHGAPLAVASSMAAAGIATVAINVVGHGGGGESTLTVAATSGAPVTFSAGGRSVDQNGDGLMDATEGALALPPFEIVGSRDGLRQTAIDLMQLVREIEVGVDVDGDGGADLDPSRVYYFGQSFGGIYGTLFMAVEPRLRAAAANVAGGAVIEVSRLGGFRPLVTGILARRVPSLLNVPGGFAENVPLRNQSPVVNAVPGALEIQEYLEHSEWVTQSGNPAAYARHLRTLPLSGVPVRPVLFQLAKGDQTVPNPTNTAILRAGGLADRATLFRNDLAFAANPAVPKNPHSFLTRLTVPAVGAVAAGAQRQIATFFASNGADIIDPDGDAPLFEVPIALPLPEDLSFIP